MDTSIWGRAGYQFFGRRTLRNHAVDKKSGEMKEPPAHNPLLMPGSETAVIKPAPLSWGVQVQTEFRSPLLVHLTYKNKKG